MDLKSIVIYLGTFSLSLFFLHISQILLYNNGKNNRYQKIIGYFSLSFSILIPCFLSALRGLSVGNDISVYIIPNIQYSELAEHGFWFYWNNMPINVEIGFAYILYIGNVFKNIGISFFIIQFLIILPVYLILEKYRSYISVVLGMAVFYLLCYNFSLSGMRGSIAMSFLLLDFYYLQQKKYYKAILIFLISFSFHNSALLIFVIYIFLMYIIRSKHSVIWIYISLVVVCIFFLFSKQLLSLIEVLIGLVSSRYVYYLNIYIGTGSISDVPATDLVCKTLSIIATSFLLAQSKKRNILYSEFLLFAIVGRIFVLFTSVFYESMRIAFYFDMFLILYIASTNRCFIGSSLNKIVSTIIALFFPFIYWLYFIMYIGGYATNIYTFR